jgi:hypothetical protein
MSFWKRILVCNASKKEVILKELESRDNQFDKFMNEGLWM